VAGGITSQAGTIVHEVTHQADGTADLDGVTDRASAHKLSRYNAARSGANYEYFIMNVPLGKKAEDSKD
jgi:hypothetical protein